MADRPLRLPENAVLLHVGTFKTGTTAIQGALFRARPQLAEHGVLHAGKGPQPMQAVLAFTGRKLRGKPTPRLKAWQRLVAQVTAAADQRVIVSSEFFGAADVETARRAVQQLGGQRVHVVVTLRPLVKIMPSQWQQYVRSGGTKVTYARWLDGMLNKPPYDKPTPSFWQRHRHDELVERWASVVGPENVTVIVPDEADRDFLLRTFEELVGLPSGLLVADQDAENRSMTLGEIELVRQVNVEFQRRGWPDPVYRKVVREGLVRQVQANRRPQPDEPRMTTPQWALDRAAEIGAAAAEKISALGVRIVGDISTLGDPAVASEQAAVARADIVLAVEAAREAVVGTIVASGALTVGTVQDTSSRQLLKVVLSRNLRQARARARRAKRRIG